MQVPSLPTLLFRVPDHVKIPGFIDNDNKTARAQ